MPPVGLDTGGHYRHPCYFLLPPINATPRLHFLIRVFAKAMPPA